MKNLMEVLEQGEFLVEESLPNYKSLKVMAKGHNHIYFTIAKGHVKNFRVATFLSDGVIVCLQEFNKEGDLINHLKAEPGMWDDKIACSHCGYKAHESNLIYHDNGEYLCEDCFVDMAVSEMERDTDFR